MDSISAYRETALKRSEQLEKARVQRRTKAWEVARNAATLLKSRYHATRVVAFGSLTQADRFNPWSDVDLGVWGVLPADYYEAVAYVLDVGGEIKVDLIRAERCKPFLKEALEQGVDL